MCEVVVSDRCYARVVLAARIREQPIEDFVQAAVDEFIATHRDSLREAHATEATILFGSDGG